MTTKPLLSETAVTLKALCSSCGLQKAGTKPVLVQRLRHAAKNLQPITPSTRILSIDLGLKNFAFSLISPAPTPKKQPPTSNDNDTLNSPVRLHAWHRLDLTLPTNHTTTTTKKKGKTTTPSPSPTPPPPPPPLEETNEEEAFSPSTLATLTTHLIKTHLLPLRPTHVLIERQRFRTAGAAAVHEWTLRVNSLEAMLHAAFAALRGVEGTGSGSGDSDGWEGRVESVQPKTVAGFLFPVVVGEGEGGGGGGGDAGDGGKGKGKGKGKNAAYTKLKREKVAMLGGFLEGGRMVVPEKGQAKEMVRLFMEGAARKGRGGSRKKVAADKGVEGAEVEEIVTKIDDLSDAVLQGMVWLQWRRNLEALIKERPELLEEEEV